ncbi:hypothetical protein ScPMuIL_004588 [Solemya velum]
MDAVASPIRPVDRQSMKPWIRTLLDDNTVEGVKWIDKQKGMFRIPWVHASSRCYDEEKDADLFKRYAQHTGRFDPNQPNPTRWKTNFRAALRSLKDVTHHKKMSKTTGPDAYRVYQFVEEPQDEAAAELSLAEDDDLEYSSESEDTQNSTQLEVTINMELCETTHDPSLPMFEQLVANTGATEHSPLIPIGYESDTDTNQSAQGTCGLVVDPRESSTLNILPDHILQLARVLDAQEQYDRNLSSPDSESQNNDRIPSVVRDFEV